MKVLGKYTDAINKGDVFILICPMSSIQFDETDHSNGTENDDESSPDAIILCWMGVDASRIKKMLGRDISNKLNIKDWKSRAIVEYIGKIL